MSKQSCFRSRPHASLPRSYTSIASGTAVATSRPMPRSSEPWPGKQKAIFVIAVPVQRITAEPQVRPAPMPVISTVSPSWTRPVATASASASGIEADEVLP